MSAEKSRLAFLSNEAGEEEGLGHAGIETYKDTPYASVARECGQNSSDARIRKPVRIEFDLIEIPRADYPPLNEQQAAVNACLKKARERKEEKELDFFLRAKEILESEKIKVLRVADYNTKGLIGPSVEGTPFHSLVKASGVSNKDTDTSGGSFGIGKNAAFAVSELQTAFYSTVYRAPGTGREQFLAQGKTILVSHIDADGKSRRATGYWGLPNFEPVSSAADVPAWLQRNEVGTSVLSIGFRVSKDWQYRIAASLLTNFFCAIYRGDTEFLIDGGKLKLNSSTVKICFQDPMIIKAAENSNLKEDFDFSKNLFECLTSNEATETMLNIDGLGKVSVRILVREGLQKRLYIIRNGMAITDSLKNFGDKFVSFPMYKEFVALVEPLEDHGSALVKRLENPRHDELSAERITDPAKRDAANHVMKKFAKQVRAAIREQTVVKPADEVSLDELSEYFSDEDKSTRPQEPGGEPNPESITYTPELHRTRRKPTMETKEEGKDGGRKFKEREGHGGDGSGDGDGLGDGRGAGGTGTLNRKEPLAVEDFRNVLGASGTQWHRKLFFTPQKTCRAVIRVEAAGLESAAALHIVSADHGDPAHGQLELSVMGGKRYTINVAFAEPYEGPVELFAIEAG